MKRLLLCAAVPAQAQISGDTIKIGIITDMSGLYSDIDGQGGVEAIKMAIADLGGSVAGKKVEILFADHQNKADVAAAKAREWFDTQGVDMLIGGTTSSTGLAMSKIAEEKKKGCYGTAIAFHDSPKEAAAAAKKDELLVLVLHVSGYFEKPEFT